MFRSCEQRSVSHNSSIACLMGNGLTSRRLSMAVSLVTVRKFLHILRLAFSAFWAEFDGIDNVSSHAPNTGATPRSNRFAVSAPASAQPRSRIANDAATG